MIISCGSQVEATSAWFQSDHKHQSRHNLWLKNREVKSSHDYQCLCLFWPSKGTDDIVNTNLEIHSQLQFKEIQIEPDHGRPGQPGAVKSVLWRHWMHATQVHPVTAERTNFTAPCQALYVDTLRAKPRRAYCIAENFCQEFNFVAFVNSGNFLTKLNSWLNFSTKSHVWDQNYSWMPR